MTENKDGDKVKDRFVRGFIAGVIAGIAMNILNYILFYLLHFTSLRQLDYAAIALFGHKATNLLEAIMGQVSQLFFSGALGVAFAYLITEINSKYSLFKGLIFSISVWFTVFTTGLLFKVPHLVQPPTNTVLSNLLGATVYGLALPLILSWLDRKSKIE